MSPSDGSAGVVAPGAARGRGRWTGVLVAAIAASLLVIAVTRKPHVYEFAHFWLTAKYFPELRCAGLYGALGGALEERYGREWLLARAPRIRDLEGGAVFPAALVLEAAAAGRSRWDPARWRAFVDDAAALKEAMERYRPERADALWGEVFVDHGVNYPPAWVAWTHLLARRVPLTPATLVAFASVDALFLGVACCAAWALGGLAGLAVALVFAASAGDLLAYATWAFCKLDWLGLIAAALLALKGGRFGVAGALWGAAAAVRIFPGALALLFAASWLAGGRGDARAAGATLRFGAGTLAGFLVPSALATALLAGPAGLTAAGLWSGYFSRLGNYATEGRMVNRVGVRAIAEAAGAGTFGALAGVAAAALALLLLFALARVRRAPERTAALSLFFAPLLFAVNHFYYLMLLLPLAARERGLGWLTAALLAVNAAVAAAGAAGVPYALALQAECLAYSLALAAVPAALFFLGRGDSATMAPATDREKTG